MSMLFSSSAPSPAPCTTAGSAQSEPPNSGRASARTLQCVLDVSQNAPAQRRMVNINTRDFIVRASQVLSGHVFQALIDDSHVSGGFRFGTGRVDHEIGKLLLFVQRHLVADSLQYLAAGEPVTFHTQRYLARHRKGGQNQAVKCLVTARFY